MPYSAQAFRCFEDTGRICKNHLLYTGMLSHNWINIGYFTQKIGLLQKKHLSIAYYLGSVT